MKNYRNSLSILALLAAVSMPLAASAQSPPPPTNSAKSSPKPDTRATESNVQGPTSKVGLIAGCAAAVDELRASRTLIDALDAENHALRTRLETEKRTSQILAELNDTRRNEADALRSAITAKNEAMLAKDDVIAVQTKLIDELKRKRPSLWRRVGDILIGAGTIAVLRN